MPKVSQSRIGCWYKQKPRLLVYLSQVVVSNSSCDNLVSNLPPTFNHEINHAISFIIFCNLRQNPPVNPKVREQWKGTQLLGILKQISQRSQVSSCSTQGNNVTIVWHDSGTNCRSIRTKLVRVVPNILGKSYILTELCHLWKDILRKFSQQVRSATKPSTQRKHIVSHVEKACRRSFVIHCDKSNDKHGRLSHKNWSCEISATWLIFVL